MDSLGSLAVLSAVLQTVPLSPSPTFICLLIQAHQQALCTHKGSSVQLLCANWLATHAYCFVF